MTQGVATADSVQITKGLQVGERVITEGGDRLKDGAKVSLPGDAASGPRRGASGAVGRVGRARRTPSPRRRGGAAARSVARTRAGRRRQPRAASHRDGASAPAGAALVGAGRRRERPQRHRASEAQS